MLHVRSGCLWTPVGSVAASRWAERQRSEGACFACIHTDVKGSDQQREVVYVPNEGSLPSLVSCDQRGSHMWTNCPEIFDHAVLAGDVRTATALATALWEAVARERIEACCEWHAALFGDDDEGEGVADEED